METATAADAADAADAPTTLAVATAAAAVATTAAAAAAAAAAARSMAPRRAAGANDVFMPCADVKLVPVAPDDQCLYRELVYKSSVVAMFDKKLPIDRLLKM